MPHFFFRAETTLTDTTVHGPGWDYVTPAQMAMFPNDSLELVEQKVAYSGKDLTNLLTTKSSIGILIEESDAATLDDTDLFALAEASTLKHASGTALKAYLKAYNDGLYQAAGSYQPSDSDLTAIAALTTASFGRGLLELANAAALRAAAALSSGDVVTFAGMVSNAGGIGYTAGAGGSVVQGTSRVTGVTLDECTGFILTTNESLANGAETVFRLSNSQIDTLSYVHVRTQADFTGAAYVAALVEARTVFQGSGFVDIAVKNESGGATTYNTLLQFIVFKGANS